MDAEPKISKQVRLTDDTVDRALGIESRTGIAEKTVYALAVEAGIPIVEEATAKIGKAAARKTLAAKAKGGQK